MIKIINQDYYDTLKELYKKMSDFLKPEIALEVGTGWGNSAHALLSVFPECFLYSVDQENYHGVWKPLEGEFGERIKIRKGRTPGVFMRHIFLPADFIFIDAAHDYESVKADILCVSQLIVPGGVIAFDDYGLTGETEEGLEHGVKRAVDELIPPHWPVIFEKRNIKAFKKVHTDWR